MRVAFERVRETFPVVIRGGQTDSGSEFRGAFGELLPERGMTMQRIQPRSPGQNGRVERCLHTGRKELYETLSPAIPSTATGRMADVSRGPHSHVRSHASPGGRMLIGCVPGHPRESLCCNRAATGPRRKTSAGKTRQECTIS